MTSKKIREARISDASQLIDLQMKLSIQTKYMMREMDEVISDESVQEDRLKSAINNERMKYWVIEIESKIVGYLIVNSRNLKRVKHIAEFVIGIDQEYWGLGFGRELIGQMLEWSSEMDLKRLELGVVEENKRAVNLYESFGFKVEGKKISDHYIGNNKYLNTLIMAKILE